MKEKESRLNVLSMNFRKEVELEHGEEIQKKCNRNFFLYFFLLFFLNFFNFLYLVLNPTKFVSIKRKSKKEENIYGKEKDNFKEKEKEGK